LGGLGSAPDLAGRDYSDPPDPLADGEGAGCPTAPPALSAIQVSPVTAPYFSNPLRTKILAMALVQHIM